MSIINLLFVFIKVARCVYQNIREVNPLRKCVRQIEIKKGETIGFELIEEYACKTQCSYFKIIPRMKYSVHTYIYI